MPNQWFIVRLNKEYGPYPAQRLKELAVSGDLRPEDLIRREDMSQPRQANAIKGLFPKSPAAIVTVIPASQSEEEAASSEPPVNRGANGFRFDWNGWNVGGKLIFIAAVAAVISMPLHWLNLGLVTANGFSQGGVLLLGFFVYPVLMLFQSRPINLWAGIGCAVAALVITAKYIAQKKVVLLGREVFVAGTGAVMFLAACIVLIVGVAKYLPTARQPKVSDPPSL